MRFDFGDDGWECFYGDGLCIGIKATVGGGYGEGYVECTGGGVGVCRILFGTGGVVAEVPGVGLCACALVCELDSGAGEERWVRYVERGGGVGCGGYVDFCADAFIAVAGCGYIYYGVALEFWAALL